MSIEEIRTKASPLAALRHRNFRWFWSGQCVSLIGSWMQRASQAWLVLEMTDSAFLLGLIGVMQFLPVMLLSLVAGVVADRVPKRKLILAMQISLGAQALILSALVYAGRVEYWHVLLLALWQGVATAFDTPTRQSFIVEMVGKTDLMNAISLNSAIFNGARVIGPAIGGLVMHQFGAGLAFLLNGLSYLFVCYALLIMKVDGLPPKASQRNMLQEIKEGLSFAYRTPRVFEVLSLVGLIGIFSLNMSILIPVLARDVLGQTAAGFGLLMSFMGAGAVCGAGSLAYLSHLGPKRGLLFGGAVAMTVTQVLLSFVAGYWSAVGLVFVLGWSLITYSATANSSLQVAAPDHLRGRVMSLHSLLNGGTSPLGNLFAGTVTDIYGASGGFFACGAIGLACTTYLLWRGRARPAGDNALRREQSANANTL
ncbi:MAG: Enterobactin exporter EntS [Firmicutes bacterium]|nr:Enterobactin exporter EntS [candidate division NPL-UPA2 bacterium]